MRRNQIAVLGAASVLSLTGCAHVSEYMKERGGQNLQQVGKNVATGVVTGEFSKSATFSMDEEFYLGKTVAATTIARLGGRALPPEHPAARYLRDVGTALAFAAAELRSGDARPYPKKGYRFILVSSPQVNAVGMPGGFVAVTTGAMKAVRSEDELAAIMAHEIAHVQLGHAMAPVEKAREQEHMTNTALAGTDKVVHVFFGKVVTIGTDFVLDKGYGKEGELQADAFASQVLASVGYDPQALQRFLSRLEGRAAEGGFFHRHPPAADRVAALAAQSKGTGSAAASGEKLRLARFEAGRKRLD
jgi:beta-barrel assembly-enhancing protease